MTITKCKLHSGSGLYYGYATSTRGLRYFFGANKRGQMEWVDRVEQRAPWTGCRFPLRRAPAGLAKAVRKAVQS